MKINDTKKCAVSIKSESHQCQGTEIWINGERLNNVTAISLAIGVDNLHRMVVEMIPTKIELAGVFDVTTLDSTAREYRKGPEC